MCCCCANGFPLPSLIPLKPPMVYTHANALQIFFVYHITLYSYSTVGWPRGFVGNFRTSPPPPALSECPFFFRCFVMESCPAQSGAVGIEHVETLGKRWSTRTACPAHAANHWQRLNHTTRLRLDDLVSQWFEEIEEAESPNKQLLPQFNLCAVPEFYSDPGLPVIPCDQIQNAVLVIHTAGSQTTLARKRAKIDLANTLFALGFRAAQLHSTAVQSQKQVCNYWEPIFITVEFLDSVHEEYLILIFQLLETVLI